MMQRQVALMQRECDKIRQMYYMKFENHKYVTKERSRLRYLSMNQQVNEE